MERRFVEVVGREEGSASIDALESALGKIILNRSAHCFLPCVAFLLRLDFLLEVSRGASGVISLLLDGPGDDLSNISTTVTLMIGSSIDIPWIGHGRFWLSSSTARSWYSWRGWLGYCYFLPLCTARDRNLRTRLRACVTICWSFSFPRLGRVSRDCCR